MSTAVSFKFKDDTYFAIVASKLKKGDFLKYAGQPFLCMGDSNLYGEDCIKVFGLVNCDTAKIRLTETVLVYNKISINLERVAS